MTSSLVSPPHGSVCYFSTSIPNFHHVPVVVQDVASIVEGIIIVFHSTWVVLVLVVVVVLLLVVVVAVAVVVVVVVSVAVVVVWPA